MGKTQASKKRNLTLLAVLGLLVIAALGLADPFGWFKPSQDDKRSRNPENKVLVDMAADDITSIEIKPVEGEPFSLVKEKDQWWAVRGAKRYRANMDKVTPILDQLPGAASEGVVTAKAEKYDELEVSPEKAIRLRVFIGNPEPKADLLVGKAAEGYKACFVRINGEKEAGKEVYRSGVNIKSLIAFEFNDYRTRKPWPFSPESATELTLRRPPVQQETPATQPGMAPEKVKDANGFVVETQAPDTLTFEYKAGFWQLADGSKGNQNQIKDFLQKLSELQVSEYVDEPKPEDTGITDAMQPSIVVKAGGETYSLILGPDKAGSRAIKDGSGLYYRLSSYPFNFYLEDLKFDELKFDDSKKDEAAKDAAAQDAAGDAAGNDDAKDGAAKDGAAKDNSAKDDKATDNKAGDDKTGGTAGK